jgi:hypothetical protein
MQGSADSTRSSNAFSASFLALINQRDEPPTAGEADMAGPWRILELPGLRFGVFRLGESPSHGHRPVAAFDERWLAQLVVAVLPGTGREAAFRLDEESGPDGFALSTGNGDELVGHLRLFDMGLVAALHVVERLVRSPEALAHVLEAAGPLSLERAGAILDERIDPQEA